jgi:hypothetical protein
LGLREHPREYLLLDDPYARTAASRAGMNVTVGRSAGTSTMVTENAFVYHELSTKPYSEMQIEVQQRLTSILAPEYLKLPRSTVANE